MAKARKKAQSYPLAQIKGPTKTYNKNDRPRRKKSVVIVDVNGNYPTSYYSQH